MLNQIFPASLLQGNIFEQSFELESIQSLKYQSAFLEKGGNSNTRLNLTFQPPLLSASPLKANHSKALPENRITGFFDFLRSSGYATELQYRALVMRVFPGQNELYWWNDQTNIKNYPSDKGYDRCLVGENGTKLAYRRERLDGGGFRYEWALTLSGQPLEKMGSLKTLQLIQWLWETFPSMNFTRLDFSLDDFTQSLDAVNITNAISQGSYRGFKRKQIILSDTGIDSQKDNGVAFDGFTANLGSRESDTYVRIYDTTVKHGYHAMRIEREVKGDHVKGLAILLKEKIHDARWILKGTNTELQKKIVLEMAHWIAAIAVGSFDFIDRSNVYGNGCLKQCPLLDWWDKFKMQFDKIEIPIIRVKPSLQRTWQWMTRQVKGTIANLMEGLGITGFYEAIELIANQVKKPSKIDKMYRSILQERGLSALSEQVDNEMLEIIIT
jgi:DNA relaxase NicK